MTESEDEIFHQVQDHEIRLTKIETYSKIMIGFASTTLPILIYVALKIGNL